MLNPLSRALNIHADLIAQKQGNNQANIYNLIRKEL